MITKILLENLIINIMEDSEEISKKVKKEKKQSVFLHHNLDNLLFQKRERKQPERLQIAQDKKSKKQYDFDWEEEVQQKQVRQKKKVNKTTKLNKIFSEHYQENAQLQKNSGDIFTNQHIPLLQDIQHYIDVQVKSIKQTQNCENQQENQQEICQEISQNHAEIYQENQQEICQEICHQNHENQQIKLQDNQQDNQQDNKQENQQEICQKNGKSLIIHQNVNENETSRQNYIELQGKVQEMTSQLQERTYINCDIRYFNLDYLIENVGSFDIILMDPPWRIRGAQQIDSQFMFSNSRFSLDYNTMSNQEIMNIKIAKLSTKGFIFLWILNTQMNSAYEILNAWGYEVVEQIIWVKLNNGKVNMTHGYYFMHSFEICLVGYKCPPGKHVEYFSKISNNLIFADIKKKSQKPVELYEIIELMMPGAKKIEIFARNHNIRPGWLSLGNQLGTLYENWLQKVDCNQCEQPIQLNTTRFKSKRQSNYDLCGKCFEGQKEQDSIEKLSTEDFYLLNNNVDEEVFHHYHQCNHCKMEPIWGNRFCCKTCQNFDLCEACYDLNLETDTKFHDIEHDCEIFEFPILADGLPAHNEAKYLFLTRCNGCYQKPIIGVCFKCSQCSNFHLCQNCFFSKPLTDYLSVRGHKQDHKIDIIIDPINFENKKKTQAKCQNCFLEMDLQDKYKCQNCFNFYFCPKCHDIRDTFKTNLANTHKQYHQFLLIKNNL